MYVPDGRSELVLEYRTNSVLMAEHEAVQHEVERVWQDFLWEMAGSHGV